MSTFYHSVAGGCDEQEGGEGVAEAAPAWEWPRQIIS